MFYFTTSANFIPYFWLIMAIFLLLAEIGTPGLFVFIAFAIGCLITGIVAFFVFSFVVQCWIALIISVLAFAALKYFFASRVKSFGEKETNFDALTGKKGIVVKEINPNEKGLVRIGGEIWSAVVKGDEVLKKDVVVKVVNVEGNKLVVKPFRE
ncbi:MAG: NfeD family protein [bacterium]